MGKNIKKIFVSILVQLCMAGPGVLAKASIVDILGDQKLICGLTAFFAYATQELGDLGPPHISQKVGVAGVAGIVSLLSFYFLSPAR